MKTRRVISLTMSLAFFAMIYTGIMLFLCPQGRVAYWTGWTLLGLNKVQYGQLHTTFMVVFVVTGIWHLVLNWKAVVLYLKNRAKQVRVFTPEFNVALVITAVFVVGTLAGWAPWSTYLAWGDSVKGYWEERDGSPPWGHAEEARLPRFVRGLVDWERLEHDRLVSLTVDDAVAALAAAGIRVGGADQKIIEIAEANGVTPQRIMEVMRTAEVEVAAGSVESPVMGGDDPYPKPYSGLGRMTLAEYAERYEVDLATMLSLLPANQGIEAGQNIRTVADALGTDPEGVLAILNEAAAR